MRIEIRFVRMRIPRGRRRFDSIRIECAFNPDKCARVDTPNKTSIHICTYVQKVIVHKYVRIYKNVY